MKIPNFNNQHSEKVQASLVLNPNCTFENCFSVVAAEVTRLKYCWKQLVFERKMSLVTSAATTKLEGWLLKLGGYA